jgi:hypothetical protein
MTGGIVEELPKALTEVDHFDSINQNPNINKRF